MHLVKGLDFQMPMGLMTDFLKHLDLGLDFQMGIRLLTEKGLVTLKH